jgi:hypothetical protein
MLIFRSEEIFKKKCTGKKLGPKIQFFSGDGIFLQKNKFFRIIFLVFFPEMFQILIQHNILDILTCFERKENFS